MRRSGEAQAQEVDEVVEEDVGDGAAAAIEGGAAGEAGLEHIELAGFGLEGEGNLEGVLAAGGIEAVAELVALGDGEVVGCLLYTSDAADE